MVLIPRVGPSRALALVLVASTALAQPPAERIRREQRVTVTGNLAEPVPEIRMAPELATVVFFDAEIDPAGLEVDRARVKVVGTGAQFVILQPVVGFGAQERVILRVPYADGKAPGQAVLALVMHPSEVDTRVEVARRAPSATACEAELARLRAQDAAPSPVRFIRAGGVGVHGVQFRKISTCRAAPATPGLDCVDVGAYVADGWTVFKVKIDNGPGQSAWRPREATVRSVKSEARVRVVEVEPAAIAPGERGTVYVECDAMAEADTADYTLELSDGQGRGATFNVKLQRTPGMKP